MRGLVFLLAVVVKWRRACLRVQAPCMNTFAELNMHRVTDINPPSSCKLNVGTVVGVSEWGGGVMPGLLS